MPNKAILIPMDHKDSFSREHFLNMTRTKLGTVKEIIPTNPQTEMTEMTKKLRLMK